MSAVVCNCPLPVSIAGQGFAGSSNPAGMGALRLSGGALSGNSITDRPVRWVNAWEHTGLITGNISGPYALEYSGD